MAPAGLRLHLQVWRCQPMAGFTGSSTSNIEVCSGTWFSRTRSSASFPWGVSTWFNAVKTGSLIPHSGTCSRVKKLRELPSHSELPSSYAGARPWQPEAPLKGDEPTIKLVLRSSTSNVLSPVDLIGNWPAIPHGPGSYSSGKMPGFSNMKCPLERTRWLKGFD